MAVINKFSRGERLGDRKQIHLLFQDGESFKISPFRVFYIKKKKAIGLLDNKVLFSVSKSRICSAVQRNKIKRLCREVYRLNKHILSYVSDNNFVFFIGYVYTGSLHEIRYPIFNKVIVTSLQYVEDMVKFK